MPSPNAKGKWADFKSVRLGQKEGVFDKIICAASIRQSEGGDARISAKGHGEGWDIWKGMSSRNQKRRRQAVVIRRVEMIS
jgi:hypothetical protein